MLDRWWRGVGDEELTALIEDALSGNLTLRAALARIEQARAAAGLAGADVFPSVQANATAGRERMLVPINSHDNVMYPRNQFIFGLSAAYEVDLWGRIRARAAAGKLDALVSEEDADACAITLAATVGKAWYSLVERRAQRRLIEEQMEVSRALLELTTMRFKQGAASSLDVHQQRQQLAGVASQLPLAEADIEVLEHQIAVLAGRPPKTGVTGSAADFREPPPLPAVGLPADLLDRRPDVRAARLRIVAADYRLAEAIANRLPALRLTSGTEYQSTNRFEDIFDRWLWNIAGGLTAPVFEGGRLKAEQERNRALVKELTCAYGQAVLVAFREVEDALTRERNQRRYMMKLEDQLVHARATLGQAQARYGQGLTDYVSVLVALQSVQELERVRLSARRNLLAYRIELYRVLGGAWRREA